MELRYIQGFRMVNALERGFLTHDRIEALLSDQIRAASFQVVQGRRSQRQRLCGAPYALQQLALSATGYALLPEDVRLAVLNDPLAVQNMAARILGRDPAEFTFAEIADFVNDETVMTVVFTSYPASQILAASETAMTAIAFSPAALLVLGRHVEGLSAVMESELAVRILVSSVVAMEALSVSATAREAIWQSQSAYAVIAADGHAIGKYVAGCAQLNPATYANIGAVAASATAMQAVAASGLALSAIIKSAPAASTIENSIQSYRASIIKTMNNTASYFTKSSKTIGNGSGTTKDGAGTNTYYIPVSCSDDGDTDYAVSSLNTGVNRATIGRHSGSIAVSSGVCTRGVTVIGTGSSVGNVSFDIYTAS